MAQNSLISSVGAVIDRVRVNEIGTTEHEGRGVWYKRRKFGSRLIIKSANLFFRIAKNPVNALDDPAAWIKWETECFHLLHGEDFHVHGSEDTLFTGSVPGESLSDHLRADTLGEVMCGAAGRELRRAHALYCVHFNDCWSHGDPHLGNFIYSRDEERARLIDFEVIHHRTLSPEERHADDLLVFLLDLCGRIDPQRWLPLGLSFVNGYGMPIVQQRLKERLRVPGGVARVWWAIRTTYMSRKELTRRLVELQDRL